MCLIAIVGGGPCGLGAALRILNTNPNAKVTIYEKRPDYTRTRLVLIDPATMSKVLGVDGLPHRIRLCDLEERLSKEVMARGGLIFHRDIRSIEELPHDWFVIATGPKSDLRDRLLGPLLQVREPKRVVTCTVMTPAPRIMNLFRFYKVLKVLESVAMEQAGPSSITLLWEPPTHFTEADILKGLRFWVNLRDDPRTEPVHWHSYDSTLYVCQKFTDGQRVFGVGDAVVGIPYFQSLKNGIANLDLIGSLDTFSVDRYARVLSARSAIRIGSMSSMSMTLDFASLYLTVSNRIPWQIIKQDKDQVEELSERAVDGLE